MIDIKIQQQQQKKKSFTFNQLFLSQLLICVNMSMRVVEEKKKQ